MNSPYDPTTTSETESASVLVVDDLPENRNLLRHILEREGHRVIEAPGGEEGLHALEKESPDTILLDVMMPGLDGFEVCRRIKENPRTQHIPVILVTALRQGDYRLKGVRHGADDYISKPYDPRYLALRVRNAVRMKHLRDQVQSQYEKLLESEKMRDGLVHMLIHDMRSPLNSMITSIELLKREASQLSSDTGETIEYLASSTQGLIGMINDILEVNRADQAALPVNLEKCQMSALIEEATSCYPTTPGQAKLSISMPDGTPVPELKCDPSIVKRVIGNLVDNAMKYTPDNGEVKINVKADAESQNIRVEVEDTGSGISLEDQRHIFDKYGQVQLRQQKSPVRSTGIGLAFCKIGVEAMGGRLGVESAPGKGSTFWFELPQNQEMALAF